MWELYFFERIAGKLIGKPDFALPFWAFDIPGMMSVPRIYTIKNSKLYEEKRLDRANAGSIVDLSYMGNNDRIINDEDLKKDNLQRVYNQMVVQANSELFMGRKYLSGDGKTPGGGSIEEGVHTGVHVWFGGKMGKFATAGGDPLFYALHGNVDRLWQVWDTRRTRKIRYTEDPDFLNASFVFYDENGEPVRVYVKDCLDIGSLGYSYEVMPIPWLDLGGRGGGHSGSRGRGWRP